MASIFTNHPLLVLDFTLNDGRAITHLRYMLVLKYKLAQSTATLADFLKWMP